ncbi:unnamed protein product [Timema podura]|uniref:Uncharacterized protein n=1 Tax=Timema podura TaxID=61482 RepID=A0ABN7P8Y8_TIMPD|nr:unnamed protein product [Timema podura]
MDHPSGSLMVMKNLQKRLRS